MSLKDNIEYWKISLEHKEPLIDEFYVYDELVINNSRFINKIINLRKLIAEYCSIIESSDFKNYESKAKELIDKIFLILISEKKVMYSEFVSFWKVLDISYSTFKNLSHEDKKNALIRILEIYCKKRQSLYNQFDYYHSDVITIQALYDSGVSRKKSRSGIEKLTSIISEIVDSIEKVDNINKFKKCNYAFFLPDEITSRNIFEEFCKDFKVKYKFGENRQGKIPDMVLKIGKHLFIIEAKHLKESGGAQDKQINELIEFISHQEEADYIHYLSFLDGLYFHHPETTSESKMNERRKNKIKRQKENIEETLKRNKKNFFVKTKGFEELIKDVVKEQQNSSE